MGRATASPQPRIKDTQRPGSKGDRPAGRGGERLGCELSIDCELGALASHHLPSHPPPPVLATGVGDQLCPSQGGSTVHPQTRGAVQRDHTGIRDSAKVPRTVGHDGPGVTGRRQEAGSWPLPCSRPGPGQASDPGPLLSSGAKAASRGAEIQSGPFSKENLPVVGTPRRPRLFISMSNVYVGMHAFLTKISFTQNSNALFCYKYTWKLDKPWPRMN